MENGALLHSGRLMKVMRIQLNTSNGIEQSLLSDRQVSDRSIVDQINKILISVHIKAEHLVAPQEFIRICKYE